MPTLTLEDFYTLFAAEPGSLSNECLELIKNKDWSYQILENEEEQEIINTIEGRIVKGNLSKVVLGDSSRWEKGWEENLEDFIKSNGEIDTLNPKYIRPNVPLRLNKKFIKTANSRFELDWYEVFRTWLFQTYLKGFSSIYEFGCGSGFNVATLAKMYPESKVVGLDWVEASCQIIEKLRDIQHLNVSGKQFDFFNPDENYILDNGCAVLTIGALEQTYVNYQKFIDYLIRQKPSLCVFIEPIVEWYDVSSAVDKTAIDCHLNRNFWQRFPALLVELEKEGKVEILKTKRSNFGSLILEGYSQIIWRPL
jgi:SAM-dependent methyltransferase